MALQQAQIGDVLSLHREDLVVKSVPVFYKNQQVGRGTLNLHTVAIDVDWNRLGEDVFKSVKFVLVYDVDGNLDRINLEMS